MGRELPRKEIDPKTEPLYTIKEPELYNKRNIRNSTQAGGKPRNPLPNGHAQLPQFEAQFKGTVADLKKLAYVGIGGARAAAIWKPRTEKARGDLPGFWNDVKLEVATRAGRTKDPKEAERSKTALDFLELAERRGGLGTRLEEWNTMVSSRSYGWDLLADTAGEIKRGIEFCKEMAREGFGDLQGFNDAQTHRENLMSALDAIASEIIREAEDIINEGGSTLNPGKPLDAVVERFKDVSPRAGSAARLRNAIENGKLHETWAKELPEATRNKIATDGLSNSLKTWQEKADAVRDVMSGDHNPKDEIDAATALDAATGAIVKSINSLTTKYASGTPPDEISMALHVYTQTGAEILRQHKMLGSIVRERKARDVAQTGPNYNELRRTLDRLEAAEPNDSVHSFGRTYEGKLDKFWREGQAQVDLFLKRRNNTVLADDFAKKIGGDLNNLLDAWAKRDTTNTDATYTLAWKLIADLRDVKSRSETLLESEPSQMVFIGGVLDAIADFVAVDLEQASSPFG